MSKKECCKSCQHCLLSSQGNSAAWCKLRKITVHSEIASLFFCYHWTKQPPSLPIIEDNPSDFLLDKQLEFGRELASID